MKKPEKIIKWFAVERKRDGCFVDHNGKPLYNYILQLPYWLAKAYKPFYIKVEIRANPLSWNDMQEEENRVEADAYFKANWSAKCTKLRKLNHNFMMVSTKALGSGWFKTMDDYNNYHKELRELNKKYGLSVGGQDNP